MARPRRDPDRPSTTERLLRAAEDAFGRFGFGGARLEDIARSVGITRPSLLYHFGSKDELYVRVLRRAMALLRRALEGAVQAGGEFAELLRRVMQTYVDFLDQHPQLASVLLREMIDQRATRTRLLVREVLPIIDWMELVLRREGAGELRDGLPVRAAILQLSTAALVRTASGRARQPLWGSVDHTVDLALVLFLGRPPAP